MALLQLLLHPYTKRGGHPSGRRVFQSLGLTEEEMLARAPVIYMKQYSDGSFIVELDQEVQQAIADGQYVLQELAK